MPNQYGSRCTTTAALCISPEEGDHLSLHRILSGSHWQLHTATSIADAQRLLDRNEISVVLCERDLPQTTWMNVLDRLRTLRRPPLLIVTSRLADECFWAEALNLGAWDVLPKPFERRELIWSLTVAWEHWRNQTEAACTPLKAMTAGLA